MGSEIYILFRVILSYFLVIVSPVNSNILPLQEAKISTTLSEYFKADIKNVHKEILTYSNIIPEGIYNISHILNPFHTQNCLTVIDYFLDRSISIVLKYPAIIRIMQPLIFEDPESYNQMAEFVYAPQSHNLTNKIRINWDPSNCKSFKHVQSSFLLNLCLRWHMLRLITYMKPWQCIIQLAMFTPPTLLRLSSYPYINLHTESYRTFHFNTESTSVFMIINIGKAIKAEIYKKSAENSKSVVVEVRLKTVEYKNVLGTINLLQMISNKLQKLRIYTNIQNSMSLDSLESKMFPVEENLEWNLGAFQPNEITNELLKCENILILSHKFHQIQQDNSPKKLYNVYANLILSALKNYSYEANQRSCENGKWLEYSNYNLWRPSFSEIDRKISITPFFENIIYPEEYSPIYREKREIYLLSFTNKLEQLKFIVCGNRGMGPLAFGEFVRIFSLHVWISIGMSVLATGVVLAFIDLHVKKRHGLKQALKIVLGHTISVLKVFVDHGHILPKYLAKNPALRWVLSGILLVSVVISNAYQGGNVENMVKPRRIIGYSSLYELDWDEYKIYTKTKITHLQLDSSFSSEMFGMMGKKQFYNYQKDFEIESEVEYLDMLNGVSLPLLKKYKSHPSSIQIASDLIDGLSTQDNVSTSTILRLKQTIEQTDFSLLFNEIRACNKTALILPAYQCTKISEVLSRSGLFHTIGRGIYTNPNFGLSLNGMVPQYIFTRIHGLKASGVLEWWTMLLSRDRPINMKQVITKPSLSGNILMIFLLLGYGIALGALVFLLENFRVVKQFPNKILWLLNYLVFFWYKIKSKLVGFCGFTK